VLSSISSKLNLRNLSLTKGNIDQLRGYDWPGNVRELENVIERAAILAVNGRLRIDLPTPSLEVHHPALLLADADIVDEAARRLRRAAARSSARGARPSFSE
jgi:transcriptional regulator with GAF, ATPase, and Fis domain